MNMTRRKLRKFASVSLSAVLALAMVFSAAVMPPTRDAYVSYAVSFSDINDHWAKTFINKAVGYGFVNGYSDGTFKPDNSITRAEFTKMLNSAIGNTGTTTLDFKDVDSDEWYYEDVSKGVAAGYISGYSETEFQPNNLITRQEAAVMLGRIVPAYGSSSTLKAFGDYADVGDWATTALEKMVAKGYIGEYNDGKLHPTDRLTRAQAAKVIVSIVESETIVTNNQTVVLSGVTLQNTIYANRISIGTDVGNGTTTISNCTILGNLNVEGAGSGSNEGVTLLNSRVAQATVHKDSTAVRVCAKGESTIKNTSVSDVAVLETGTLSGTGDYGQGFVNVTASRAADLELKGAFKNVTVSGAKVDLNIESGTVESLDITSASEQANIALKAGTVVSNANVYAEGTSFTGTGLITKLNAYANGITYETDPTNTTVSSGVTEAPYKKVNVERALTITSAPANGATKVATNESIVLEFSSPVHITGSTSTGLTDAQAESIITMRRNSTSGTVININATVSSDYKKITIKPTEDLSEDTTYYLRIAAGELTDMYYNENQLFMSSFTTGTASMKVTFSPSNNSTSVSLSALPMIIFSDSVARYSSGSDSITSQYLHDSVLNLEKRGPNDTKRSNVSFKASIDSANKVITITPNSSLEEETTYYITIYRNTLMRAEDSEAVAETEIQFTTVSDSVSSRIATAKSATSAQLSFTALQKGTVYGIIFPQDELGSSRPTADSIKNHNYVSSVSSYSGHYDSVKISSAGNSDTLDFYDLDANTSYYIYTVLYDSSGTARSVFSDTVTTDTKQSELGSLQIGASTDSYANINLNSSASNQTYYIGTKATTLYVKPVVASSVTNPTCMVTYNSSIQNVSQSGQSVAEVNIPEGTSSPGSIDIRVGSTDSGYSSKTYTVKLIRINPGMSSCYIEGTAVSLQSGNDSNLTGIVTENVTLPATTDMNADIKMAVYMAESDTAALSGVRYTVYKYNSSSKLWGTISTGTSSGGQVTLDKYTNYSSASGIYKIVTTSTVNGTTAYAGTGSESETRYISVQFSRATS